MMLAMWFRSPMRSLLGIRVYHTFGMMALRGGVRTAARGDISSRGSREVGNVGVVFVFVPSCFGPRHYRRQLVGRRPRRWAGLREAPMLLMGAAGCIG